MVTGNSFLLKKVRFPRMFRLRNPYVKFMAALSHHSSTLAIKTPQYPFLDAWEVLLIPLFYYLHLIRSIFSHIVHASIWITAAFSIQNAFRYAIISVSLTE